MSEVMQDFHLRAETRGYRLVPLLIGNILMRKTHRYLIAPLVAAVAFGCMCEVCYSQPGAAENKPKNQHIAIPTTALFGKPLGDFKAFDSKTAKLVYPESVQFDLDNGVVCGLVAIYPAEVTFADLVDAVNETQRKWWRDANGEMSKFGVTVWRNDDLRISIQVSGSQVVMIWLDPRMKDRTNQALSKGFLDILHEKSSSQKKPSPSRANSD
jgi:hypothetical protein